jgi:cyclopropane-fatty-acyl-phospholipid synthase
MVAKIKKSKKNKSKSFINYKILIFVLIILLIIVFLNNSKSKIILKRIVKNIGIRFVDKKDEAKARDFDIIVNDDAIYDKILKNSELGLGESYMDKDWDSKNLPKTISILKMNEEKLIKAIGKNSLNLLINTSLVKINDFFYTKNTIDKSKANISHHYDIGNDLYEKMIGKTMQYTCAYYNEPDISLDEAQIRKMRLVAKKLDLKEGQEVLDIGCGFGAMAYFLATNYKVKVTGVTLSKNQKEYADKHYKHPNVKILFKDYRHVNSKYDRIYSIGMFEAVGRENYKEYYDKCYNLLHDNGIMLIHTIGTKDRIIYNQVSFLDKYIFPEGELPHISNLTQSFSDKWHLEDLQNFGLSYAKTLRAWHKNIGNWEGLEDYNERFRRMWDYYLLSCVGGFRVKGYYLYHLVYTKRSNKHIKDLYYIRDC